MVLHIEAGHGDGYRTPGQFDFGLFNDAGESEAAICREYAGHLRVATEGRGNRAGISLSGQICRRLTLAIERKADLLISFHLDGEATGAPGGRILYGQPASAEIALAISDALALPVEQAPAVGLLAYTPSIEIRLGNIASWKDMKALASRERRDQICTQILDTLERLYSTAQ